MRTSRPSQLAIAVAALAALSPSAWAQSAEFRYPTFDINDDGYVNDDDYAYFEYLRDSGDEMADVNFDGVIDSRDDAIARESSEHGSLPPAGYSMHWSVTGETDPRISPINLSATDFQRDVDMIYQPNVPHYPRQGYHIMLESPGGGFDEWESRLDSYLSIYFHEFRTVAQSRSRLQTPGIIAIIDYESAGPEWEWTTINQANLANTWRETVEEINSPTLDTRFMEFAGFEFSASDEDWADLNNDEREELAELAWNTIGQRLYLDTLTIAREVAPNALWGYWGFPHGMINVPVSGNDQRLNNSVSWLLSEVDVYCPSFYETRYVEPGSELSCTQSTPQRLVDWFLGNMSEVHRTRQAFNPTARILPYVWYHYGASTCVGSADTDRLLSDTNTRAMFTIPKYYAADGLLFWGHFFATQPAPDFASTEELQPYIDRWTPLINHHQRDRGDRGNGATIPVPEEDSGEIDDPGTGDSGSNDSEPEGDSSGGGGGTQSFTNDSGGGGSSGSSGGGSGSGSGGGGGSSSASSGGGGSSFGGGGGGGASPGRVGSFQGSGATTRSAEVARAPKPDATPSVLAFTALWLDAPNAPKARFSYPLSDAAAARQALARMDAGSPKRRSSFANVPPTTE